MNTYYMNCPQCGKAIIYRDGESSECERCGVDVDFLTGMSARANGDEAPTGVHLTIVRKRLQSHLTIHRRRIDGEADL